MQAYEGFKVKTSYIAQNVIFFVIPCFWGSKHSMFRLGTTLGTAACRRLLVHSSRLIQNHFIASSLPPSPPPSSQAPRDEYQAGSIMRVSVKDFMVSPL